MGMGRNGNPLHGREWECKKPFPGIYTVDYYIDTGMKHRHAILT